MLYYYTYSLRFCQGRPGQASHCHGRVCSPSKPGAHKACSTSPEQNIHMGGVSQNLEYPLRVAIIRITVFWGLYRGPPTLGNYHIYIYIHIFYVIVDSAGPRSCFLSICHMHLANGVRVKDMIIAAMEIRIRRRFLAVRPDFSRAWSYQVLEGPETTTSPKCPCSYIVYVLVP